MLFSAHSRREILVRLGMHRILQKHGPRVHRATGSWIFFRYFSPGDVAVAFSRGSCTKPFTFFFLPAKIYLHLGVVLRSVARCWTIYRAWHSWTSRRYEGWFILELALRLDCFLIVNRGNSIDACRDIFSIIIAVLIWFLCRNSYSFLNCSYHLFPLVPFLFISRGYTPWPMVFPPWDGRSDIS